MNDNQPPLLPNKVEISYDLGQPGGDLTSCLVTRVLENGFKVIAHLEGEDAEAFIDAWNSRAASPVTRSDNSRALSEILQYNDMSDVLRERLKLLLHSLEASQPKPQQAEGCNSHSCRIKKPTGMATNGPCYCPKPQQSDEGLQEALEAEVRQLETDKAQLLAFATHFIQAGAWDAVEPDGGDIQDTAAKYGLLKEVKATEENAADWGHMADVVEVGDIFYVLAGPLAAKADIGITISEQKQTPNPTSGAVEVVEEIDNTCVKLNAGVLGAFDRQKAAAIIQQAMDGAQERGSNLWLEEGRKQGADKMLQVASNGYDAIQRVVDLIICGDGGKWDGSELGKKVFEALGPAKDFLVSPAADGKLEALLTKCYNRLHDLVSFGDSDTTHALLDEIDSTFTRGGSNA